MKSEGLGKHLAIAGIGALVLYFATYAFIQHRREVKGPWQVDFKTVDGGVPAIVINQPGLDITNVTILFSDQQAGSADLPQMLRFDKVIQAPPYEVPFGEVIYFDTTFLPGVVTFNLFSHEIELLPRVLFINRKEHPWQPHLTIPLAGQGKAGPRD
jgi:hypothetical protein